MVKTVHIGKRQRLKVFRSGVAEVVVYAVDVEEAGVMVKKYTREFRRLRRDPRSGRSTRTRAFDVGDMGDVFVASCASAEYLKILERDGYQPLVSAGS